MIAPNEIIKAVGHWKPAGRIYGETIRLQKQGIQYREALEIAMRNPKNWDGFENYK